MANKILSVVVTARPRANLEELMKIDGPLAGPCGTVGPSLARRVFEGNGYTIVGASYLAPAFDTNEGVQAMFDNFDFTVKDTFHPLIYQLLRT